MKHWASNFFALSVAILKYVAILLKYPIKAKDNPPPFFWHSTENKKQKIGVLGSSDCHPGKNYFAIIIPIL